MARVTIIISLVVTLFVLNAAAIGAPTGPNDTLFNEQGEAFFPQFPSKPGVDCEPDQVIAQFLNNALSLPDKVEEAILEQCKIEEELLGILLAYEVYYVEKTFKGFWPEDTLMTLEDESVVGVNDLSQVFLLKLREGHDIFKLISNLQEYHDCYFAEPNGYMQLCTNDTYWSYQWNLGPWNTNLRLYGINCPAAWPHVSSGPPIGILDTGIDYNHADFMFGFGSGKIPIGYDYLDHDWDPYSNGTEHATACAGIAAGITNNSRGIAGVSGGWYYGLGTWGSPIIPLRISYDDEVTNFTRAVEAIRAAADPAGPFFCDILSNSYRGRFYSEAMRGAVCYANIAMKTFVAAKGNDGDDGYVIPADIDGSWVISVGAYTNEQLAPRWGLSNYGNNMDLVAPYQAFTTFPGNQYGTLTGTSAACPHVSGAAALVRELLKEIIYPRAVHPDDIDRIISYSSEDWQTPIGYDDYFGNGRLNVGNAITRISHTQPSYPPWRLFYHRTQPAEHEYNVVNRAAGAFNHKDPYDLSTGRYCYAKYEVRVPVAYEEKFIETPKVWGRGMNVTKGWSPAVPNNMAEYCGVIPSSEQIDGCVLQTFVYEIWRWNPWGCTEYLGWYPCRPQEVECEYTIWGRLADEPPPPLQPDSGDGKAAIITEIAKPGEELYPNPFNNSIKVSVSVSLETELTIRVFDITGRQVGDIYSGRLPAGRHDFVWEAKGQDGQFHSSGLYFVRFNYPDITKIKRVTLLR